MATARRRESAYEKYPWRLGNLQWLRAQRQLWKGQKLRLPYLEFLGDTGDSMYRLLKPHLPDDSFFVGMDIDPVTLVKHVFRDAPFELILADGYEAIPRLLRGGRRFGAVNLDTTEGVRPRWWSDRTESVRAIVELATQGGHSFALVLNHTLDRGSEKGTTVAQRLEMHADALAEAFGAWRLKKETLLRGSEGFASGVQKLGYGGGFEVYRSAPHRKCPSCSWEETSAVASTEELILCPTCSKALPQRLRMLTVRLAFDGVRRTCAVQTRPASARVM